MLFPSGVARTNRDSKLPGIGFESTVVVEERGCRWSLRCSGFGSSSSSTRPSTLGSILPGGAVTALPPTPMAMRASGDGGGLRDCDRRASVWRNGIGENMGVDGVESMAPPNEVEGRAVWLASDSERGNASHVEVTSNDFSTARRYFPTYLYCF